MEECDWVSCEVVENQLRMTRIKSTETGELKSEHSNPQLSTTFKWLDGNDNDSIVIPLAEDEQFYSEDEEMHVESDIEQGQQDVVHLELDDEQGTDCSPDSENEDNGKLLPLFISHILCCEQYQNCFKLGSIVFSKVKIFGTIVATEIINRKNTLRIDDGTSQIVCYMEDSVNDFEISEDSCDDDDNIENPYYQFNQTYMKKIKEDKDVLPTFDKLNVGDRVLLDGKLSLYKNNFYIFIRCLNRPKSNTCYDNFIEQIFELFETYYDFGLANPDRSQFH